MNIFEVSKKKMDYSKCPSYLQATLEDWQGEEAFGSSADLGLIASCHRNLLEVMSYDRLSCGRPSFLLSRAHTYMVNLCFPKKKEDRIKCRS
jgi:hypothetical protein